MRLQNYDKDMRNDSRQTAYLGPFFLMVFLFFIVGFLTTANTQFQAPLKSVFLGGAGMLKNTFATLITFSWFLAYPISGPIGSIWVNRRGYKVTLLRGLLVMFIGLGLTFLSSWETVRYPDSCLHLGDLSVNWGFIIFLAGSFVTGASATILQVVLNPYLSACNVRGTQPIQRLAIGGTSNSIGTTIAPYFISGIVFGGLALEDVSVAQIRLPYLVMMLVIAVVLGCLAAFRLPDIEETRSRDEKLEKSVWSFRHLTLGVMAIFIYVGCEVCIGGNINLYAIDKGIGDPALLATVYWGLMLVGRAFSSTLSKVPAKTQLTVTTTGATVMVALAIILDSPWLLAFTGLFHSIMWGAIFTLSTAHLGKYTSAASGVFMIGVFGGAVMPLLQGGAADAAGGWRLTWLLILAGEVLMLLYARYGSKVIQRGD